MKGHSNDKKNTNFTRLELLNIEMDTAAKDYWQCLQDSGHSMSPPIIQSHNEGWSLWHGDSKIASPDYKTLYHIIQDPTTMTYWARHDRFPEDMMDEIDWEASGHGLTSLPTSRRRWVTKHASENCGVGATMVKWKMQDDAKCPRCGQDQEDTTHVLKCSAAGADEVWQSNMQKLETTMIDLHTRPDLLEALMARLNQWRRGLPFINDPLWTDELVDTVTNQDRLGWKNLLECLPVKQWKQLQQRYFNKYHPQRSIKRWMNKLLQQIHNVAWSQWDHRNKVLHKTELPRVFRTIGLLNDEITKEYAKGPADLPPTDRYLFTVPLLLRLARSTTHKQSWIRNIQSARQRQQRRKQEAQEAITISHERSYIIHWSKTGRVR